MPIYLIATEPNTSATEIRKRLALYCNEFYSVVQTDQNWHFLVFVTELDDQEVISQLSNIPILAVEEIKEPTYSSHTIFVDSRLENLETIVDNLFVGGYVLNKSVDHNVFRIIGARQKDVFNLACYLGFLKNFPFAAQLNEFPVVVIQNLPMNFDTAKLQNLFSASIKIPIIHCQVQQENDTKFAIVLFSDSSQAQRAVRIVGGGKLGGKILRAFLLYEKEGNKQFQPPPPLPASNNFTQNQLAQQDDEFQFQFTPNNEITSNTFVPNQVPAPPLPFEINQPTTIQNPVVLSTAGQYLSTPQPAALLNESFPVATPSSSLNPVVIYPNSVRRSIILQIPQYMKEYILQEIRKYGVIERIYEISTSDTLLTYQVVYSKEGSRNTAMSSSKLSQYASIPKFGHSLQPKSPVRQLFPPNDANSTVEDFTPARYAVIVALDREESFDKVLQKLPSFGEYTRILCQEYSDRTEYEIFFKMAGSMETLLTCKEFKNSAAPAIDLLAYRNSLKVPQMIAH